MLYAINATDKPNSIDLRRATRAKHLEYVNVLVDTGRVALAGPFPSIDSPDPGPAGFSGSLIVAEFESLEAAEQWAMHDPYSIAGLFTNVSVKPFVKVKP